MKLTKSKQFLADAIHANGKGWPDGANWAAQDKCSQVTFFKSKPKLHGNTWLDVNGLDDVNGFGTDSKIPNWHQTVLSRDEYFSAYPDEPVADADGWIKWEGGECPVGGDEMVVCRIVGGGLWDNGNPTRASTMSWRHSGCLAIIAYRLHKPDADVVDSEFTPEPESKPTIEQLAADYRNKLDFANRKQQKADDAKAAADAALLELERAGEALGLLIGIVKPEAELVITDWRDLMENDVIRVHCFGNLYSECTVLALDDDDVLVRNHAEKKYRPRIKTNDWKFIRRP